MGQASQRESDRLQAILRLRVIIGYLGEQAQFDWWPTGFYTASSPAFLNPVFARTTALAQYHGVKEAARRVCDEHIGVGRVFHLFRLPETLEQSLFEVLQDPATVVAAHQAIGSRATALDALQSICKVQGPVQEGPLQIGTAADLDDNAWLAAAAGCYHAAFAQGVRSYPYLVDRA
ncbi:BrxE family protein [uncultured Thiodictyon sp.]|uniref:BrxE family protein n=1 Tax=uncultured Thiodictyon sp. TaxID=1846217 RepID=UPI002600865A|nr:BrxE family protein [uncultured Thiodictyon sp.]